MANSICYHRNKYFWFLIILLQVLPENSSAEDSAFDTYYCGTASAKTGKTCISVRLPWQSDPIYFCTNKEKINYRSNCGIHGVPCHRSPGNGDLLIATPWDCCPLVSTPDYCINVKCMPPPFNRTCVTTNHTFTIVISPISFGLRGECCPKYFCDSGSNPEDCESKKQNVECMPPPNKTNCVAFRDEHGCCEKYQCDQDAVKPGVCPPNPFEGHSPNVVVHGDDSSTMTSEAHEADSTINVDSNETTEHSATISSKVKREISRRRVHNTMQGHPSDGFHHNSCTGDFTCPGEQKCCPHGHGFEINSHTTLRSYNGHCKHPPTNKDYHASY